MGLQIREITQTLENLAPIEWAEDWDNCGLLLGTKSMTTEKVLVALDATKEVLDEAKRLGANLVVTHHPLFLKPLHAIETSTVTGGLIKEFLKSEIALYTMHTNYDRAPEGLNAYLGRLLDIDEGRPLEALKPTLYKLVVYVPKGHEEILANAAVQAGAGQIGRYSHCSFRVDGTGTFRPEEGTHPYIGETGRLEMVEEVRLETVFPAHLRHNVISAVLAAHPYEEVAYDIYTLTEPKGQEGLGRFGTLSTPMTWPDLLQRVKERFGLTKVRVGGAEPPQYVKRLAVTGGSGASLLRAAARHGVEIYLTGDIKYHDYRLGEELGVTLVDVGHFDSEVLGVNHICEYLRSALAQKGKFIPVVTSEALKNPFHLA